MKHRRTVATGSRTRVTARAVRRPVTVAAVLGLALGMLAGFPLASPAQAVYTPVFTTMVDDAGANDEPGQKDLNYLQVDDTQSDFWYVNWSFDEVSGFAGANTGDGCAMFDTDGDGKVNYSYCVTFQDNAQGVPTQIATSPRLYSCGDDKVDRCTNPIVLVGSAAALLPSTATVTVANVDPFPTGDDTPKDTLVETKISRSQVGAGLLTNVCSFPSEEPNSDPSDCVITPGSGFLTIVKDAGNDTTTPFVFDTSPAANGGTSQFTINGSGSVDQIPFATSGNGTASVNVLESIPNLWQLNSVTCTTNGVTSGTASTTLPKVGAASAGVNGAAIKAGQETVCTFVDRIAVVQPDITVDKTASPDSVDEPGGQVTFSVTVTNNATSAATLTALSDDVYGDLDGSANADISDSTCATGATLAASGGTYSCSFKGQVTGDAGSTHTDTVTATATNAAGSDTATDDATVTITNVNPTIDVTKSANPTSVAETGGSVTYTVTVDNTSIEPVTLNSLNDDTFGDLDGVGSCDVPQTLAVGGSYSCTFTKNLTGNAGGSHVNIVTGAATDNEGNQATDTGQATVTFTDVLPVAGLDKSVDVTSLPEPGGVFTYTLTVTNKSDEAATITALTDDNTLSQECTDLVGTTLAAGASTSCTYTVTHTDAGTYPNTASVTLADNDGNSDSANASQSVEVTDALPSVSLDKSASPTTMNEPGGVFTFTLTITNHSVEPVTITDLTDDNILSQECTDLVGTTLGVGQSTSCTYYVTHVDAGSYDNTAAVTVQDDDGNPASADDTQTVTVDDVLPTIDVTKSANPTSVAETGGSVTYTVTVDNTSIEPVTLNSLNDDTFGDLDGVGSCDVPQTLAVGGSYSCTFTKNLTGNAGGSHVNIVTGAATDNEGNQATDTGQATVTFTDVLPSVSIDKSVTPGSRPEPGGVFTYTLTITNTGLEAGTISALTDSYALPTGCTSLVGTTLAAGASTSCTYTKTYTDAGNSPGEDGVYDNTAAVTLSDNDGNSASASDDATAIVTDVLPEITVDKTASPKSVIYTGGNVTYTFTVRNYSVEPVTVFSLTDNKFGDLDGKGTCDVPQTLAVGGSYTCTYTVYLSGTPGTVHRNEVTAMAEDDEHNITGASDYEVVKFLWNGRTPGYWKTHSTSWPTFSVTNYAGTTVAVTPSTKVTSVYRVPASWLTTCSNGSKCLDLDKNGKADTLLNSLGYQGGTTLQGGAQILLRAATAAILNEAYFGATYPPYTSVGAIVTAVNTALNSGSRSAMVTLANTLDYWNNGIH